MRFIRTAHRKQVVRFVLGMTTAVFLLLPVQASAYAISMSMAMASSMRHRRPPPYPRPVGPHRDCPDAWRAGHRCDTDRSDTDLGTSMPTEALRSRRQRRRRRADRRHDAHPLPVRAVRHVGHQWRDRSRRVAPDWPRSTTTCSPAVHRCDRRQRDAARALTQATWGPTYAEINALANRRHARTTGSRSNSGCPG